MSENHAPYEFDSTRGYPGGSPVKPRVKRGFKAWDNVKAETQGKGADDCNPFGEIGKTNRLIVQKVDDATNFMYMKDDECFLKDARRHQAEFKSTDELDEAMAAYMSSMSYLNHAGPQRGSNLLSGMNHVFPEWKGNYPAQVALCSRGRHWLAHKKVKPYAVNW